VELADVQRRIPISTSTIFNVGSVSKQFTGFAVAMLVNEAVDAVRLRIASPKDIELAMTRGVNYPKGLLAWGDEIGVSVVLERLETLQKEYGEERYRPARTYSTGMRQRCKLAMCLVHDPEVLVLNRHEVVEIAAHRAVRDVAAGDLEAGDGGVRRGQEAALDRGRGGQLLVERLGAERLLVQLGVLDRRRRLVGDRLEEADLVLLNTCSIREKADQKIYSDLGTLRRWKQRRPGRLVGEVDGFPGFALQIVESHRHRTVLELQIDQAIFVRSDRKSVV
jgi:hypothetical protein